MALKKTIVIAGGGSGGHIYPGIAIANALKKIDPTLDIRFVGTDAGLEKKIVPKEGFQLHFIRSGQLNVRGNLGIKIKSIFKIFLGFFDSARLLIQLKPYYILGVGGYASGPFVLTAACFGYNTAIWEPNAMPGLANRWLARFVKRCFLVFEEARKHLKNENIFIAGMPIREEIEVAGAQHKSGGGVARRTRLLLFGGSQGARALNNALSDCILQKPELFQDIEVVHQTGAADIEVIRKKYERTKVDVQAHEFLYDMPERYKWADLIIGRAGASTLAEAAAFGLVPILIPLTLADDHQLKNAESLVKSEAARLILQKDLTPQRLGVEISQLKENRELRERISTHIRQFHKPHAAHKIASEILFGEMKNGIHQVNTK